MYQIQFGLYVTGAKDAYLVLYNPDVYPQSQQLIIKHIQKDSEIQALFADRFREYEFEKSKLTGSYIYTKKPEHASQCNEDVRKIVVEYRPATEASATMGVDA